MIKNYVKTNREKDHLGVRYEIDKNGREKKLNTYRKSVLPKDKRADSKRPKSSLENVSSSQGGSKHRKVPKTYQSPSGTSDEPRKPKVKVYKLEKGQGIGKSEDRGKHLKSKSQSNFSSNHGIDHKTKRYKNSKMEKTEIYSQNFMTNELHTSCGLRKNMSKITSSGNDSSKSPMKTISNFQQMRKIIKKVNHTLKSSRAHYPKKPTTESDISKNNSLIAESGCSGFFGNNRNREPQKEHSGTRISNKVQESQHFDDRINFYPYPQNEVDFKSLEFQEPKEEFKVTRLKSSMKERSPDTSKDNIPEYYFDLSKMGDNEHKRAKVGSKEKIKSYQLYKRQ